MRTTGAALILTLLERQGVEIVAGIPGGANLPLYDALGESRIRHVLARHEQGAGFIAQGIARVTGKPAVCFGTSGPGATNLLTAIADAKLDSVPLVGLTIPITKHNYLVRSAAELLEVIPDAFRVAASGRPGPVVIDVPKDVQTEALEVERLPEPGRPDPPPEPAPDELRRLARLIDGARRPVVLAGAGVIAAGAAQALRELAQRASLPVASTLLGLGALPSDHPLALGMVGMHGAPYVNQLLEECDLLLALGMRFDDRATGKASEFCPQARIAHVDIDASEIGKIKVPVLGVRACLSRALPELVPLVPPQERAAWRARLAALRATAPLEMPGADDPLEPYGIVRAAAALLDEEPLVTTDVGQHQMWVAQAFPFRSPRQLLTSGGLGTMGFGLPAAIGAALAAPGRTVLCFTGDRSLLMNLQELATAAEEQANVKVILLNNGHLGLVRQQQELFYGGRYRASRFHAEPDFAALARAFGVPSLRLGEESDPGAALARALAEPGPCLVDVPIGREHNVYPMVPPGAANRDMLLQGGRDADAAA